MPDEQLAEPAIPQITASSTKQEMLAAYKEMVKRLKEKRETELKPQQRAEEKQKEEAVQVAESLSTEGIAREVGNLRSEISKVLIELSDREEYTYTFERQKRLAQEQFEYDKVRTERESQL